MARIEIIAYSPAYDAQLRALCELPVSGNISLALEREPNYYTGSAIQCHQPEVYLCLRTADESVVGVFNIGFRKVYYRGEEVDIRYLCDLRIHPEIQGSALLFRMVRFVRQLNLTPGGLPAQTIVFGDNHHMLSMIERLEDSPYRNQLPSYHSAGRYISHLIGFQSARRAGDTCEIRRATDADIPQMQEFIDVESKKINYFPVYHLGDLGRAYYRGLRIRDYFLAFRGDTLVGVCGVWDQSAFKQTRIVGYSTLYSILKPFYHVFAKLSGGRTLPPSGSVLKYLNLHTILISHRDSAIFQSLVSTILEAHKDDGYDYLLCGLDAGDPLTAVMPVFRHRREVAGRYFLVNQSPDVSASFYQPWFYLEAARI